MKLINADALKKNLEMTAERDIEQRIIPGYNVCVIQNGKVAYKNCFGTISYDSQEKVRENTLFRLASMTKPITACAVMSLVEKGKLDIYDDVKKYLPEFSRMKTAFIDAKGKLCYGTLAKNDIKLIHLLTHTSGLCSGDVGRLQVSVMSKQEKATLCSYVEAVSKTALSFEPFTKQEYSAVAGFNVLARIVELVSDTDYSTYLKQNIFDKCNMPDTCFVPTTEQWTRFISMSNRVDGKGVVSSVKQGNIFEDYPCTHFNGGAGLASTLDDYVNFARMLLDEGVFDGTRILSQNSVRLIGKAHVPESIQGGFWRWGFGVRVITGQNIRPVGSYGWSGAYGSHFWIDPENKIAAVYMKNSRYDGGAGNKTAVQFEKDVYNSLII